MAVIIIGNRMTTPMEICAAAGQGKTMLKPQKLIGFVAMKRNKMAFANFSTKY
jgi:hypothetical protein